MNSYFWATPSGPINLIEGDKMPTQPHYGICETEPRPDCFNKSNCLCAEKWKPYRESLQRAKESSVPIQDQERAAKLIVDNANIYSSLIFSPDTIHGPFTVEYRIEDSCAHDSCPVDGMCEHCKEPVKVAILLPEKERPWLREALREVKANNKELRDSYNDPTRLDFRIKDSRGFPTGEVVDEAKVTPDKEPQEDSIEALRKELAECKQAYNQQLERNTAIAKDLEYWAQRSADLLKELEQLRKQ